MIEFNTSLSDVIKQFQDGKGVDLMRDPGFINKFTKIISAEIGKAEKKAQLLSENEFAELLQGAGIMTLAIGLDAMIDPARLSKGLQRLEPFISLLILDQELFRQAPCLEILDQFENFRSESNLSGNFGCLGCMGVNIALLAGDFGGQAPLFDGPPLSLGKLRELGAVELSEHLADLFFSLTSDFQGKHSDTDMPLFQIAEILKGEVSRLTVENLLLDQESLPQTDPATIPEGAFEEAMLVQSISRRGDQICIEMASLRNSHEEYAEGLIPALACLSASGRHVVAQMLKADPDDISPDYALADDRNADIYTQARSILEWKILYELKQQFPGEFKELDYREMKQKLLQDALVEEGKFL